MCKRLRLLKILARFRRLFRQMFCLKAKLGIFRWASSFYFEGGQQWILSPWIVSDCCRSGFVKNGLNKKARTHILRSRKCCGHPLAHFNFSIYFSLFWGVCFRRAHMRCACGMRAPMDYFSLNFATSSLIVAFASP